MRRACRQSHGGVMTHCSRWELLLQEREGYCYPTSSPQSHRSHSDAHGYTVWLHDHHGRNKQGLFLSCSEPGLISWWLIGNRWIEKETEHFHWKRSRGTVTKGGGGAPLCLSFPTAVRWLFFEHILGLLNIGKLEFPQLNKQADQRVRCKGSP